MGILVNQNDFSHGELDPKMLARSNMQLYMKGAQNLRNVVVIPQGGVKRRFGTTYIGEAQVYEDQVLVPAPTGAYMLAEFIYDDDTTYLFVFTDSLIAVYKDDAIVAWMASPYTSAMLLAGSVNYTQKFNQMILTQEDTQPRQISRGATDAIWSIGTITFKNLPAEDFSQDYDGYTFDLDVVTVGIGRTLTSSDAVFVAAHVGGLFQGIGDQDDLTKQIGSARITALVTNKIVTVEITSAFDGAFVTGVSGAHCLLAEVAWSTARGWPISCSFYEGRLVFGGSKALRETLFMSIVDDYRNFDVGSGLEANSIQVGLDGTKVGEVKYVLGDKTLQIFASRSEHTIPQLDGRALTPANASIRRQSSNGIETVIPQILDNQTFYVKRGGKGVMNYVFSNDQQSYNSKEVSIISPHLIVNPVDSAILSGSSSEDANYLFLVNNDGTLAGYQSLIEENVSAWTLSNTTDGNSSAGLFKRVAEVDDDIYFIVERTIDESTVQYLEKLNWDIYTDCSSIQTLAPAGTTIANLEHLEGQVVQVRGDGYVLTDQTVASGEITIEKTSTEVEVGLEYNPLIKPMPVQVNTQTGPTTYIKKRIIRAFVDYYESIGVVVDSVPIPYLNFDDDVLLNAPSAKTGIYEYNNLSDWERRESISITQTQPFPMTILGVGYEISVKQAEG